MKKIVTKLFFVLFLVSSMGQAVAASFVINDIRVKGLQKLDVGAVYNYLPLKVGDEASDEDLRQSIQQLFQTGFFNNVELEQEGSTLVVTLVERPSIASITINGNGEVSTEDIQTGLDDVGIVEGRILNPVVLSKVSKDLEQVYLDLGRYSATVNTEVTDLERNRVAIAFNISEGKVAKIKKINFIGVEKVNINELRDAMLLKEKRGLRIFSRQDQYSKQKLQADLGSITNFYQDRGFSDFRIVATNVEISPNKQDIFINIAVDEGNIYTAGGFQIEGVSPERVEALSQLVVIKEGELYSQLEVSVSRSAIANALADEGYAFVDVRSLATINSETRVVETLFAVTLNTRVYVRRINILGNLLTRDEVIRREIRQYESGWYSAQDIALSESRLLRLGLFETVAAEITNVPGTTDQVDLTITVQEFNTGSLNFSLGYSEESSAQIGIEFTQRNLLGTGKQLSFAATKSKANTLFNLSYTNPFYTQSGVSRTLYLNVEKFDTQEISTVEYVADSQAVGMSFQIPISENNSLSLGGEYQELKLKTVEGTPMDIAEQISENPDLTNGILTAGVSRDTRNNFYFPTSGSLSSVNLLLAVPGSQATFYKVTARGSYYQPIGAAKKLSLKGSLELGYGGGYGKFDNLPFYENYFAGGPESVRGFRPNSLGPQDEGQPVGGDKLVLTSVEFGLPPFGSAGSKDKQVGVFVDGGMVFSRDEAVRLNSLRYSAGLFFNWYSNIGPFSMSYGVPLKKAVGDSTQEFQLSLGALF